MVAKANRSRNRWTPEAAHPGICGKPVIAFEND